MNTGLYLLVLFCWGTTWLGVAIQVDSSVPIFISIAWRFLLASALLFIWCAWKSIPLKFDWRHHRSWFVIGLFLFSGNYISVYLGTQYLPSGLVALLFSTITIFVIFNGYLWFNKPIAVRSIMGSLIGIMGLVLLFGHETLALTKTQSLTWHSPQLKGLGWTLLGTFIASIGMLISGRLQAQQIPLIQSNAFGMLYGALTTLVMALLLGHQASLEWSTHYLGSLLFLALFGSVIGFGAYLKLLNNIGADKAAYVNVFTPMVALYLSTLFESYQLTNTHLLALMLIVGGNIMVLYKSTR